jgi:FAD/FMN-containing dehydrogenase
MSVQVTPSKAFRKSFSGNILIPGDSGYDESRKIFNAMIDKHPAMIAQCENTSDVIHAIRFASEKGLEIAIRGGGHGVAGRSLSEGGLVIDLRKLNSVQVNAEQGWVKVAAGATMSHLDRATEPFGMAAPGGRVSTTGVGGYMLGGGDGWLARKMGLACDSLVEVELVTAAGEVIHASNSSHPDLFWALHGGGGNFGVATSFTLKLHPMPVVTAAILVWKPQSAPEVIQAYRNFMKTAPDEVGGGAIYFTGTDDEFVPPTLRGKLTFAILMFYAGPKAEALEVASPLFSLHHQGAMTREMSYAELQCMLDDPPGYRNYWSAEYLNSFPDQAILVFDARAAQLLVPSPSQLVMIPQGGAIERGPEGFPLPWRHAPWCIHPFGLWEDPAHDQQVIQWTRALRDDLKPWASGDVYLNFIGDEGTDRVVAGFGRENYEKLTRIKTQYDPGNIFHLNHNIKPA